MESAAKSVSASSYQLQALFASPLQQFVEAHHTNGIMRSIIASAVAGLAYIGSTFGQACQNNTLQTTVPTNGTEVALQSYSYCGGTLNVTVSI